MHINAPGGLTVMLNVYSLLNECDVIKCKSTKTRFNARTGETSWRIKGINSLDAVLRWFFCDSGTDSGTARPSDPWMPSGHLRSFLEETSWGRTDTSERPLSSSLSGGHNEGTHAVKTGRKQGREAGPGRHSLRSSSSAQTIPLHQSHVNARTSTPDLSVQPPNMLINHASLVSGAEHAHAHDVNDVTLHTRIPCKASFLLPSASAEEWSKYRAWR